VAHLRRNWTGILQDGIEGLAGHLLNEPAKKKIGGLSYVEANLGLWKFSRWRLWVEGRRELAVVSHCFFFHKHVFAPWIGNLPSESSGQFFFALPLIGERWEGGCS